MSNVSLAQSQVYALGYGARRRLSFALLVTYILQLSAANNSAAHAGDAARHRRIART